MKSSEPEFALPKGTLPAASPAPALPKAASLPKALERLGAEVAQIAAKPGAGTPGAAKPAPAAVVGAAAPAAVDGASAPITGAAESTQAAAPATLADRLGPIAGWAAPAALVPLLVGVGLWWWKKKKAAAPQAEPKKKAPLDLYADWKAFRRQLPRSMRRALDDLQPVIVLGNNASEKELLSLQLSRVADNEQLFPGRVSLRGKGLDVHLGARSLVLVPSDEFLDAPASSEDDSWRRVLLAVARVRAPRVVVCLAQQPLDSGNLDEVTLWTSKLRAHVDAIVAVRNEDVELSIALVQSPTGARQGTPRLTDALFELSGALAKHEGAEETLRLAIDTLSDQLSPRVEERREGAKRWVSEKLRRCRKGWPRLLARPEHDAARVLMLARFFEEFESWSACLGAGLAELCVRDERQTRRVLGQELCFVPCVERRLLGSLAAFEGPDDAKLGRWRPRQSLVHRLGVTTGACAVAVLFCLAYARDRTKWDDAATAALRYDPTEGSSDIDVVRHYIEEGTAMRAPLSRFFERKAVQCLVVEKVRSRLHEQLDHAVEAFEAPENLLQLVGLIVAGTTDHCSLEADPNYATYAELTRTIEEHVEQWRHASGMSEDEIAAYIELACPQTKVQLPKLEAEYGKSTKSSENRWAAVPSVAAFAESLGALQGECHLTAEERRAIDEAEATARALSSIGERHGAALQMLQLFRKLDTPTMGLLTGVFDRYERRLQAIEDLGDEHEGVALLARDLLPFSDLGDPRQSAPEVGSIVELNRQLRAHLMGDVPEGEAALVRLTLADNTYVIDRQKVRASLLVRALDHLERDFVATTLQHELAAGAPDLAFFPEGARRDDVHHWATPGSIPSGIHVLDQVPWRHTEPRFREAVLGPLETMHELFGAQTCGDGTDDRVRDASLRRVNEFVTTRLGNYLRGFAESWHSVYDSFELADGDDAALADTLAALSRPTSSQLALLREVLRQTRLTAADGWPFVEMLAIASAPFDTLEAVLTDKALAEYQGLLLELANAGQDTRETGVASWAPVGPPAPRPASAREHVAAFMAGLSGFGRAVVSGLYEPKQDVRGRAQAWAKGLALAPALSPTLMRPIDAAYAHGNESFARGLTHFWVEKSRELRTDITDRFPFNRASSVDASVEVLSAWFDPLEGRFGSEVLSIYRLATACGPEPCVELPPGMESSVNRLLAIQEALFDEKGEPRRLKLELDPVPFATQALLPKRSVLRVGDARYEYFNTAPRTLHVEVPWNEAYVASLSIELVESDESDELAEALVTRKSPWSALRLLAAAPSSSDGRYTWELDATAHGIRRGTVHSSYDVCQDVGRCGGLFEKVLGW